MTYRVDWPGAVLGELAAVWLAAPDRAAVTAASHQLEQALARDPYALGFPRNAAVNRTAIELPLGIDYEVIEDDKTVRVLAVWSVV
jgi:hypothetical protein